MKVSISIEGIPIWSSRDETPEKVTTRVLAAVWWGMTDEEQADFFEDIAKRAEASGYHNMSQQAYYIGRHMATCSCCSHVGREFLEDIVAAWKPQGEGVS